MYTIHALTMYSMFRRFNRLTFSDSKGGDWLCGGLAALLDQGQRLNFNPAAFPGAACNREGASEETHKQA